MPNNIKFTVITINYNNQKGLSQTIQSVLSQTYSEIEYLVIDGGSNDGSVEEIKKFQDRITYWVSEKDRGIYNAMNKGIDKATGDYLIFMNSGDHFYSSEVLTKANKKLQESSVDFLVGSVNLVKKGILVETKNPPQRIDRFYLFYDILMHQGTFIKKTMFHNRRYDESFKLTADFYHILESILIHKATYAPLDYIVANYDLSGISSDLSRVQPELDKVYQNILSEEDFAFYQKKISPNKVLIIEKSRPSLLMMIYKTFTTLRSMKQNILCSLKNNQINV